MSPAGVPDDLKDYARQNVRGYPVPLALMILHLRVALAIFWQQLKSTSLKSYQSK